MTSAFEIAVQALQDTNAKFADGKALAVPHSVARAKAIGEALTALAAEFGVTIAGPLHIDSRGEFMLTAKDPADTTPRPVTGKFGAELASILNEHNPRQGVAPGPFLHADSGWCYMNHFDAERLVLQRYESATQRQRSDDYPR